MKMVLKFHEFELICIIVIFFMYVNKTTYLIINRDLFYYKTQQGSFFLDLIDKKEENIINTVCRIRQTNGIFLSFQPLKPII